MVETTVRLTHGCAVLASRTAEALATVADVAAQLRAVVGAVEGVATRVKIAGRHANVARGSDEGGIVTQLGIEVERGERRTYSDTRSMCCVASASIFRLLGGIYCCSSGLNCDADSSKLIFDRKCFTHLLLPRLP